MLQQRRLMKRLELKRGVQGEYLYRKHLIARKFLLLQRMNLHQRSFYHKRRLSQHEDLENKLRVGNLRCDVLHA